MSNISAKELLVNCELPPITSSEYVDFWLEHINYCKSGVTIGGIDISPWLYWHTNFFKITVDVEDEWGNIDPKVLNLDLRDNEWLIDYALQLAYKSETRDPLMIFGTRRFAKSTVLASRVAYRSYIQNNAHSVIVGADTNDIGNITKYLDEYMSARQSCFSDLFKQGQWNKNDSDVEIVFSERELQRIGRSRNPITEKLFPDDINWEEKKLIFSRIAVRNLEHGKVRSKEEILAGITPTEVIFDEVGKYLFSKQWLALDPALSTKFGKRRTVALFVGTGGNTDMSQDAEEYFFNPADSSFQGVDIEEFKKIVGKHNFPWEQVTNTPTGLFVPADMSLDGGRKLIIPLSEYIQRDYTQQDLDDLEGLNIQITDWENTPERIQKRIESHKKKSDRDKFALYLPFQPEDCFKVGGKNPFPVDVAQQTKRELEETGMTGKPVELKQNKDGSIDMIHSDKEVVTDYPFKGGIHDAPMMIYEDPLDVIGLNTNVGGFDGYKIEVSETTDSLGSFYIFKRKSGISGYQNQIVASLGTRPARDSIYYRQVELGLMLYNAYLLPERDSNLYKYLQKKNKESLIVDCKNLVQGIVPGSKASTMYGLPPTEENKQHLIKLVVDYCWKEIILGYEEDDTPIMGLGVQLIPDPMLLEEIIQFGRYKNYDRIIAFGLCLAWDNELTTHGILPDTQGDEYTNTSEFNIDRVLAKNRAKRRGHY